MNDEPVISVPVSADLSAYSDVAVSLTATGIAIAASGDRAIGIMTIGNNASQNGETCVGKAATVKLFASNGLSYVSIGNNTAITCLKDSLSTKDSASFF